MPMRAFPAAKMRSKRNSMPGDALACGRKPLMITRQRQRRPYPKHVATHTAPRKGATSELEHVAVFAGRRHRERLCHDNLLQGLSAWVRVRPHAWWQQA